MNPKLKPKTGPQWAIIIGIVVVITLLSVAFVSSVSSNGNGDATESSLALYDLMPTGNGSTHIVVGDILKQKQGEPRGNDYYVYHNCNEQEWYRWHQNHSDRTLYWDKTVDHYRGRAVWHRYMREPVVVIHKNKNKNDTAIYHNVGTVRYIRPKAINVEPRDDVINVNVSYPTPIIHAGDIVAVQCEEGQPQPIDLNVTVGAEP